MFNTRPCRRRSRKYGRTICSMTVRMIGLNKDILRQYVEYIYEYSYAGGRADPPFQTRPKPNRDQYRRCPMFRSRHRSGSVSSLIWSTIDSEVDTDDLSNFQLLMGRVTLRITGTQLLCRDGHSSAGRAGIALNVEVEYQCQRRLLRLRRTRLVAGQAFRLDYGTLAFIQPGEILPRCRRAKGDIEIEMQISATRRWKPKASPRFSSARHTVRQRVPPAPRQRHKSYDSQPTPTIIPMIKAPIAIPASVKEQ